LLLMSVAIGCPAQSTNASAGTSESNRAVHVQMRNVIYHFTDRVAVHLRRVEGELVPTGGNEFPIFDDKNSFFLRLDSAEIAVSTTSLANVLNTRVFAASDAPIKDISIDIERGKMRVKGKLHNKGDIAFETLGTLQPTADGKIQLHAEKVTALHLPVKGLMDFFGVEIADLIKTGKVRGVKAEKDDLILDPQELFPAPHIQGRVTSLRLEASNIVQIYGTSAAAAPARIAAQNYMAYSGNRLRFGKLTMHQTDMILIDMDPKDAFDFYLDHYQEQLTAGYTKITPSFGLRVFMRDFHKLPSHKRE
jgi:hypothetical protein